MSVCCKKIVGILGYFGVLFDSSFEIIPLCLVFVTFFYYPKNINILFLLTPSRALQVIFFRNCLKPITYNCSFKRHSDSISTAPNRKVSYYYDMVVSCRNRSHVKFEAPRCFEFNMRTVMCFFFPKRYYFALPL